MTRKEIRAQILKAMAELESNGQRPINSSLLAEKLDISKPEVERHLDILADSGEIKPFKSLTGYGAMIGPAGWKSLEDVDAPEIRGMR